MMGVYSIEASRASIWQRPQMESECWSQAKQLKWQPPSSGVESSRSLSVTRGTEITPYPSVQTCVLGCPEPLPRMLPLYTTTSVLTWHLTQRSWLTMTPYWAVRDILDRTSALPWLLIAAHCQLLPLLLTPLFIPTSLLVIAQVLI